MSDTPKLTLAPNVTVLPVVTTHDIPVQRVLDGAAAANLRRVLLVGADSEGNFYFSASYSDGGDALWDIEKAKLKLLGALA